MKRAYSTDVKPGDPKPQPVIHHGSPKRERERDVVVPPKKTGIVRRKRP